MSPIQDNQYEDAMAVEPMSAPVQNDLIDNDYQADYKFSDPVSVDNQQVDNSNTSASEIPDDWFLPKVFKGSKKTNN